VSTLFSGMRGTGSHPKGTGRPSTGFLPTGRADGLWYLSLKGHGVQPDYARVNNGPWGVGTREFTSAFRVSGVGTAVTPEPASLLLLGTGLALTRWRRRGALQA